MKVAWCRPWVIKTQPDNVDQFLQTAIFLLSACSVGGGGAGCQCYSGRGECSVSFFVTKGTNLGNVITRNLSLATVPVFICLVSIGVPWMVLY